jgi:serine/threonine-protein kinase HipA
VSYEPTDVVEVRAWDRLVGAVAQNPDSGSYTFAYDPKWISGGVELAPLMMPLRSEPYAFPDLSERTFYGLPAMLADALPDAFGNALVNAWMSEHGVPAEAITPLDRLAYAADRAIGALEFRPPARDHQDEPPSAVALADLVQAARLTVRGEFASEEAAHAALQQLIQVGTSAGGARAKAVVSFNPTTYQIRSAYAPHEDGFEQWLIKLDGVSSTGLDGHGDGLGDSAPYGRLEYAYFLMAVSAGITMSECRLLAEGPRRHFMTRRFDRTATGGKLHLQSLCALSHLDFNLIGTHSYDQYFDAVTALGLGPDAMQESYRRMVFNVAGANHDDHTKNHAFLATPSGDWSLAPAYDVAHAYRPDSEWTSRHLMSVNGHFDGITLDDLHVVADRHGVRGYRRITSDVLVAMEEWMTFAAAAEVPEEAAIRVAEDLGRFRPR